MSALSEELDSLDAAINQSIKNSQELMGENAKLKAMNEALISVLERAMEELRMIRMKDCNAVYDITLRAQASALLPIAKGQS